MKRIIYPLILLLLAACQHDDVLPEATSAAKEVYLQYADRKDLTVALIGNYQGLPKHWTHQECPVSR